MEELYEIFGNKLPEKHVFFATRGTPTAVVFEKTYGEWNDFSNEYLRYAAKRSQKTATVKETASVKDQVKPTK